MPLRNAAWSCCGFAAATATHIPLRNLASTAASLAISGSPPKNIIIVACFAFIMYKTRHHWSASEQGLDTGTCPEGIGASLALQNFKHTNSPGICSHVTRNKIGPDFLRLRLLLNKEPLIKRKNCNGKKYGQGSYAWIFASLRKLYKS